MTTEEKDEKQDKFERLVLALEQALKNEQPTNEDEELPVEYEVINSLSCDIFIDPKGGNNWTVMKEFEKFSGARIFCQERDSFGWLIGGIEYKGKKAYYG